MRSEPASSDQQTTGVAAVFGKADRTMAGVSTALMVGGCILLSVVMLWIVTSIIARGVGGFTVVGTAEVAANSVVAISLLCAPYVIRRGGHIRTGIVVDRLPPGGQRIASLVAYLIGAAIFAIVAWAAWDPMLNSWAMGEYSGEGSLRIPTGPLRTIVVTFAVVMVVEFLLAAWKGPQASALELEDPADAGMQSEGRKKQS